MNATQAIPFNFFIAKRPFPPILQRSIPVRHRLRTPI
jgi:hypothetical protein